MNKNKKIRTRFARLLAASIFATTASGALAGQASGLRPPAVPLLAHNPNFSVWSPADRLTDANTWNYRKTDHPLVSLIRVDGKSYRLMGAEPAGTPALEQQSVKVTPTRTTYEFAGAGVHVTLCFMQPMFPDDLEVFSWPLGYLTWQVRSTDGAPHKVQLYQSTSSLLSVEGPQWDMVEWQRLPESELTILRVGMKDRLRPAARGGDNWRYILAAARSGESGSAIGENKVLEQAFISSGELPKNDDSKGPRKAIDAQPVAAFAFDLGKVGAQPMERQVLIGCDERFPLQFMVKNLRPYWARNGGRMEEILQKAARQYPELLKRSEAFDRELTEDLVKVGGAKYAEIAVLSYRQAFAACGLAADAKGLPMFFPKEITSNACISTIDVIFPMSPILLALSPSLAKASLVPVLIYSSSPRWRWPSAPHDLGTYPVAAGLQYRDDGGYGGPGMPVESSASVILMCDAIALADGNADFVAPWWPVLTRWANYLEKVGYDPDKQVCTDDFMGPLAHNVNLSAKSIVALAAYGDLCRRRGDEAGARKYTALARTQAAQWLKAADDGDHYRLAFDLPGTWSQKYNLVWDTLLGLNVFPAEVARKEVACYKTHIERYGVPLDSRTKRTKSDWTLWSAALASDRADFEALIAPYYTYLDTTSHRVPMTDYYETTGESSKPPPFHARPVIGAVFVKLMADPELWKKWAGRDRLNPTGWAPAPPAPQITTVIPLEQEWRYTTEQPKDDWTQPGFDDSSWKTGRAGFGVTPNEHSLFARHTEWNTKDIWLRREFVMPEKDHPDLHFLIYHNANTEVYLNGVRAIAPGGHVSAPVPEEIPEGVRRELKPGAKVKIAVHCKWWWGLQGVDVGLADVIFPPELRDE